MSAEAREISGGRLHLRHGPIDIILKAWGEAGAIATAQRAAVARFATILDELVGELGELRRPMDKNPRVATSVALRMVRACAPFANQFVTPMAAVAGSVADELLDAMRAAASLDRAFVNNGGDIAIHVAPGRELSIGLVTGLSRGLAGALDGAVRLDAASGVGGVATSGWPGRSFSLGIADAVTVLARNAASADAAATMIANAVDTDSPAIRRAPASALDPDSDLGERPVTVDVGFLSEDEIERALTKGLACAGEIQARGMIIDAAVCVKDRVRILENRGHGYLSSVIAGLDPATQKSLHHRGFNAGLPG